MELGLEYQIGGDRSSGIPKESTDVVRFHACTAIADSVLESGVDCFIGLRFSLICHSTYINSIYVTYLQKYEILLPLDGAGRFGGNVVDDAVDAADLADDAAGYFG